MTELTPFHVAFRERDLAEARRFYGEMMGCPEGRSAPDLVDEPYVRFTEGEVAEQGAMFFLDSLGKTLEFKAFRDLSPLFAK